MIAVCDANVSVSAAISPVGPSARVIDRWRAGHFDLATSPPILDEIDEVIRRTRITRYLRRSPEWITELLADLNDRAIRVEPVPIHGVCRDPKDDLVLGTALAASADYLVTGDDDLLSLGSFRGIVIVTPRQFLDILEQGQ